MEAYIDTRKSGNKMKEKKNCRRQKTQDDNNVLTDLRASVGPDDAGGRVVDAQAVRPPKVLADHHSPVVTVHVGTLNLRHLAPVCPEHVPTNSHVPV